MVWSGQQANTWSDLWLPREVSRRRKRSRCFLIFLLFGSLCALTLCRTVSYLIMSFSYNKSASVFFVLLSVLHWQLGTIMSVPSDCVEAAARHSTAPASLLSVPLSDHIGLGMKTVRIFSDRIRDRIRLEEFRFVRIRVRIFNIRYRIRIRILKSYICDVDIQSYLIRYD